ncbi:tubulin monoglycylase TTLL3 isoform X2 [Lates calcarifer]|uniref:Tubulin monoglycylase TTLL3 isoform X2 n=1 Tax=Lates calcarifer TaxID=8187 RepID=A0A4W6FCZ5_LATCA|nr:tubulin monoglycylase TTLL3 isoform X2 [Lates calcarifer]XP_050930511.1 tubulin monoglycylase TTLL3 isoform X2 [Lates calcarifer]
MRADVIMQASRSRQYVQLCQEGHQGGTGGPFKNQKVTAVVQQCSQDEAKRLQTSIPYKLTTNMLNDIVHSLAAPPEGKVRRSFISLPVINPERLKTAKALVEKAVKMHKVFSIQGPYPVVREALRARGWVEQRMHRPNKQAHRRHSDDSRASSNDAGDSDNDDDDSDDAEKEQDPDELHDLMSRMVRNEMVYFYWTNRRDAINTTGLQKEQITNHFAKAGSFTTKAGLCVNLRNLHWFDSADPDNFFPRCYRLGAQDEKHAFIEDYRRTACISLLKYIVEREQGVEAMSHRIRGVKDHRRRSKRQSKPVVLSQMIDNALKVCQEFLESLEHNDIDISLETPQTLTKEEWAQFIESYYLVVHGGAEIENSDHFVKCCKAMLQRLGEVCPQLDIDGIHNIWIIKPGAKSRGRGIKCAKHLDPILRLVNGDPTLIKESKWVVQKYLERPMLVHGTKFDVRQWFLVTDWNPLTVWFYKKCYLRFSTQPYSLDTLDSSVHLCNNSIQKHLRPSQQRHRGIPADNMWSDDQFKTFLSSQGREAQWQTVVVPGMKKAIIHALQTTQDLMESRKNTFELYGADFMLGRDLRPWLIEINASPTMAPSTPVTAQLCAAVQEDTLRVVLDRRVDRTANTGDFQLIYRQAAVEVPQYVGVNLLVEGFRIKSPCQLPPLRSSNSSAPKHRGTVKEKEPAAEKVKPLPKMLLKSAEIQPKNASSGAPPPPPLPAELPVPVPIETVTLHLPMTVNKSIHLPMNTQSQSVLLWKRRSEVSKVSSDKVQPCTSEKHQGPSSPLEITVSREHRQAATGTLSA